MQGIESTNSKSDRLSLFVYVPGTNCYKDDNLNDTDFNRNELLTHVLVSKMIYTLVNNVILELT